MRYGLLFLSFAMLAGGGVVAQSAVAITHSAQDEQAEARFAAGTDGERGSRPA